MKNKILVDIIKDKNVNVPLYLFRLKDKLNVNMDEFFILMYLYNNGELLFDINKISLELGIDIKELMIIFDSLSQKNLIEFKVVKNDKNIIEEYVSLDNFYNKVSLLLMDVEENNNEDSNNIFEKIEQGFGRTLNPMEYEIIRAWIDAKMSNEIIECALKECIYNGVTNFAYMDRILCEWQKKNLNTKENVEKNKIEHRKKQEEKKKTTVEVFDDDWLS